MRDTWNYSVDEVRAEVYRTNRVDAGRRRPVPSEFVRIMTVAGSDVARHIQQVGKMLGVSATSIVNDRVVFSAESSQELDSAISKIQTWLYKNAKDERGRIINKHRGGPGHPVG